MQLGGSYRHGTERYVGSLLASLRADGHDAVCLAGDPRGERGGLPFGAPVDGREEIRHLPSRGWSAVHGFASRRLETWLARFAPDVVHLASPAHVGAGVAIACRRLGIPWVVTMMDYWWVCPRGTLLRDGATPCDGSPAGRACLRCVLAEHPAHSLRGLARRAPAFALLDVAVLLLGTLARGGTPAETARWLRRRERLRVLLDEAARILFPSPATRDRIVPLLAHDRWEEIPYGLGAEWFESLRSARPPALDPGALVIGFAGSLQRHKGPDLLLDAVRRLGWTKTRLRIAGTPDDAAFFAELQEQARGLRVDFVGPLGPEEMRAFLRGLDLFVVASRWPENSPFVLLEAQAAGVPVVASDVAGISHRIPDSRMLFVPGSPEDLARALNEFLAAPSSLPAPPISSLDDMTRATEAAYRKALGFRAPMPNQR